MSLWIRAIDALQMTVPKTAMNQQGNTISWQNDVGPTRQVSAVQSEPVAKSVKRASNRQFGGSIARAYSRHIPAASLSRKFVGHQAY
jgi:hypothetical protein